MVIIVSKEGQLANRILHASSFIVNAKENKYKIRHLFFDEYYFFFSERLKERENLIRFWGKKKTRWTSFCQEMITFLVKVLLKLGIKKLPFFELIEYQKYEQGAKVFDLNNDEFIKKARSKIVFVYGWLFRDPVNQKKNKPLLIETWTPNKEYLINVGNYYNKYKKDHDVVIGVHIRGGDYKKFEGGKWFYTPDQYYEKMKEIALFDLFANKKIAFVICTNEKNISLLGTDKFSVFNEVRHFIEDIYLLAKCDYIIGPPSTFSMWASFYGNVPLYMLRDIDSRITTKSFNSIVTTF